jgi:penicillin-binding protein 1C
LAREALSQDSHFGSILYPVEGLLIARDPDIPGERQRIFLEARPASASLHWELDGEALGSARTPVPWRPLPGEHRLALVAGRKVLDQVRFSVR